MARRAGKQRIVYLINADSLTGLKAARGEGCRRRYNAPTGASVQKGPQATKDCSQFSIAHVLQMSTTSWPMGPKRLGIRGCFVEDRMTRGPDGSLFLFCTTLSFAASCWFIPALSTRLGTQNVVMVGDRRLTKSETIGDCAHVLSPVLPALMTCDAALVGRDSAARYLLIT